MITSLKLKNFKCFEDVELSFRPFTLLSGINGMGKSSAIQALLLLRQSFQHGFLEQKGLLLNGNYVELGTATDALYEGAEDQIQFSIDTDSKVKAEWKFHFIKDRDILPLESPPAPIDIYLESLFSDSFQYLQAERKGPRTSFKMSDHEVLQHGQVGKAGEYCAHLLAKNERKDIPIKDLAHLKSNTTELRDQVEAWIGEISPGTRIHVTEYSGMDIVNLEFSFVRGGLPTRNFRATNVGFGLTYILPIFVAVLASAPGGIIIVENPEAHLHPKGQAIIGQFLAKAAHHGLQVIVETHSDHVLNGLRAAVKDGDIDSEKVMIHFFTPDEKEPVSKIVSPRIDENGRLDIWPEDFFDEWEKGLTKLL